MSKWDGKLFALTINPQSSPELYDTLCDLPSRARAERLRQLATIGLTLSAIIGGQKLLIAENAGKPVTKEDEGLAAEGEAGVEKAEQARFRERSEDLRSKLSRQLRS